MPGDKGKNGLSIVTVKSAGLMSSVASVAARDCQIQCRQHERSCESSYYVLWFHTISPLVDLYGCGSGRDVEPSGAKVLRMIQIRLATLSLQKISLVRQANLPQGQIAIALIAINWAKALLFRLCRLKPRLIRSLRKIFGTFSLQFT